MFMFLMCASAGGENLKCASAGGDNKRINDLKKLDYRAIEDLIKNKKLSLDDVFELIVMKVNEYISLSNILAWKILSEEDGRQLVYNLLLSDDMNHVGLCIECLGYLSIASTFLDRYELNIVDFIAGNREKFNRKFDCNDGQFVKFNKKSIFINLIEALYLHEKYLSFDKIDPSRENNIPKCVESGLLTKSNLLEYIDVLPIYSQKILDVIIARLPENIEVGCGNKCDHVLISDINSDNIHLLIDDNRINSDLVFSVLYGLDEDKEYNEDELRTRFETFGFNLNRISYLYVNGFFSPSDICRLASDKVFYNDKLLKLLLTEGSQSSPCNPCKLKELQNAFTLNNDQIKALTNLHVLRLLEASKACKFSADEIGKYVEYSSKYVFVDKNSGQIDSSVFYSSMSEAVKSLKDNDLFLKDIVDGFLNVLCSNEKYLSDTLGDFISHFRNVEYKYDVNDFLFKFLINKQYELNENNMKLLVDWLCQCGFFNDENIANIITVINGNSLGVGANCMVIINNKKFFIDNFELFKGKIDFEKVCLDFIESGYESLESKCMTSEDIENMFKEFSQMISERLSNDLDGLIEFKAFANKLIKKGWLCIRYISSDSFMRTIVFNDDGVVNSNIIDCIKDESIRRPEDIANIIYIINKDHYFDDGAMKVIEILPHDLLMKVIACDDFKDMWSNNALSLVKNGKLTLLDLMILYSREYLHEWVFEDKDKDGKIDLNKLVDAICESNAVNHVKLFKFPKTLTSRLTPEQMMNLFILGYDVWLNIDKLNENLIGALNKCSSRAVNDRIFVVIERIIQNKLDFDSSKIIDLYMSDKINFTLKNICDLSNLKINSGEYFISDDDSIKMLKKYQSANENKLLSLSDEFSGLNLRSLLYFCKLRNDGLIKISSKKMFDTYKDFMRSAMYDYDNLMKGADADFYKKGFNLCGDDIDGLIKSGVLTLDKDLIALLCLSWNDLPKCCSCIDIGKALVDKDLILWLAKNINSAFIVKVFVDGYEQYKNYIDKEVLGVFRNCDIIDQNSYDQMCKQLDGIKSNKSEDGGKPKPTGTGNDDKPKPTGTGTGTKDGDKPKSAGTEDNGSNEGNDEINSQKWLFFGIHLGWYILGFLLIIGVIMFVSYVIDEQKIDELPADNPVVPVSIEELIVQ